MSEIAGFNFLNNAHSRRVIRLMTIAIYFIIFQFLILFQKPFLQFDFVIVFYLAFGGLFAHHLMTLINLNEAQSNQRLTSYLFDFLILIFFMKYFPYLSSFVLVLQLFFLFIASFDLNLFNLSFLGFVASLGSSLINLATFQTNSVQSLLSLTLFNLSYLAVILISSQLRAEFFNLQTDLSQTWKKWKSQEDFSKSLIEKLPLGLAVAHINSVENEFILENPYLTNQLKLSSEQVKNLISIYDMNSDIKKNEIVSAQRVYSFDKTSYFDEEIRENLNLYLIKDVTELRNLENQLKENEKLAAVGTLAAGIAHEIRNPLAGISGSIQMLSQETVDPTQKKLMNIVLREIDRLNGLITEFLEYAKPEKTADKEINLTKVIEETITSLKHHPEITNNFQWKIELLQASILGFSDKLKQALLNIIINSIQAMKNSSQPQLEIKMLSDEKLVLLSIRDNGVGMTAETRKKIFEPFHTTKPKGTGLGLAITHKILELHQAQIEVKSELNKGTEFIIKFPLNKGG